MQTPAEHAPEEVAALQRRGVIQLVDVRTPAERRAARIPGDLYIELDELPARVAELDRSRTIVFYCRSGARSGVATDALRASGFDARNMSGGILEWHARGLPLEPAGALVS